MLISSRIKKIKIKSCGHLGDIINIVQCNANIHTEIYTKKNCSCCGNPIATTIQFINDLIDAKITVREVENDTNYVEAYPIWLQGQKQIIYQQAKNIITQKKCMTICSFTGRSGKKSYRRKYLKKSEIFNILNHCETNIINIGDEPIDSIYVKNQCDLSVEEKFNLINMASNCLTIDNGIAHMCAMTGTETTVFYPKWRDPSLFMPKNQNIKLKQIDSKIY